MNNYTFVLIDISKSLQRIAKALEEFKKEKDAQKSKDIKTEIKVMQDKKKILCKKP